MPCGVVSSICLCVHTVARCGKGVAKIVAEIFDCLILFGLPCVSDIIARLSPFGSCLNRHNSLFVCTEILFKIQCVVVDHV